MPNHRPPGLCWAALPLVTRFLMVRHVFSIAAFAHCEPFSILPLVLLLCKGFHCQKSKVYINRMHAFDRGNRPHTTGRFRLSGKPHRTAHISQYTIQKTTPRVRLYRKVLYLYRKVYKISFSATAHSGHSLAHTRHTCTVTSRTIPLPTPGPCTQFPHFPGLRPLASRAEGCVCVLCRGCIVCIAMYSCIMKCIALV